MSQLPTTFSQQLKECQRPAPASATTLHWWRRAYARIFRFLLARYGDRTIEPAAPSTMPFVDATQSLVRQPGRTSGEVQRVLKDIHAAQPSLSDASTPGGMLNGPSPEDWITIATRWQQPRELKDAVQQLRQQGFSARLQRLGSQWCLQVPMHQREEAFERLSTMRQPENSQISTGEKPWRELLVLFVVGNVLLTLWLQWSLPPTAATRPWLALSAVILVVVSLLTVAVVLGAFRPAGTQGAITNRRRQRRVK